METCRWWIIRDKQILHTCVCWSFYVIWNIIVMHDTQLAILYADVAGRCGLKLPIYKTFLVPTQDCSSFQTRRKVEVKLFFLIHKWALSVFCCLVRNHIRCEHSVTELWLLLARLPHSNKQENFLWHIYGSKRGAWQIQISTNLVAGSSDHTV